MMPSMSVVSRFSIRVRTKPISCLVFSSSISGLACWLRRQFGAITIDKLFTSILVRATFSGAANTLPTQRSNINKTQLAFYWINLALKCTDIQQMCHKAIINSRFCPCVQLTMSTCWSLLLSKIRVGISAVMLVMSAAI